MRRLLKAPIWVLLGVLGVCPLAANAAFCPDAGKTPTVGVNESVSGNVKGPAGTTPANFVMVFPANPDTEAYAKYLASGGKAAPIPAGTNVQEAADRALAQMQQQVAKLPSMLSTMQTAAADARGNFQCGGLQAGSYLILTPVTIMKRDPMFGGRLVPQASYFMARAQVPRVRAGARGKLIAHATAFSQVSP